MIYGIIEQEGYLDECWDFCIEQLEKWKCDDYDVDSVDYVYGFVV